MVIWILGLSGSGKTTLAKLINKNLKNKKFLHIDGDLIRKIYEKKLGHTIKDRLINAQRISQLVKFLSDQNINMIVSVLSNFPRWLKWNRNNIKNYFEIYLDTNLKILKKRKPNLYSGRIKNVVGIDIKFNEPKNADMTINNCNNLNDLSRASKKIIKKIKFN
jgi:adenylylsulfate kinase